MLKESLDNKLSYVTDLQDGYSVYHMTLDGRIVFKAKASKTEVGNPIYIMWPDTHPNSLLGWEKTPMRAFVHDEGNGFEHITSDSMKNSIYGNLVFILSDMAVGPKQK